MVNIRSLPFRHTIGGAQNFFYRRDHPRNLNWEGVDPSVPGNLPLVHNLIKVAST